jgi:hypothetical protein
MVLTTTDHDLSGLQYKVSLADMDLEQLNKSLPQFSVGGKGVGGKVVGKTKKTWQFEGKDYPCTVLTFEGAGAGAEVWYTDDPYFLAVLPGGDVRTVMGDFQMEVVAARFAALR